MPISKATVDSDNTESDDEKETKSAGGKGAKSSLKLVNQLTQTELKAIVTDRSLLMPERVGSGQIEFDECH